MQFKLFEKKILTYKNNVVFLIITIIFKILFLLIFYYFSFTTKLTTLSHIPIENYLLTIHKHTTILFFTQEKIFMLKFLPQVLKQ